MFRKAISGFSVLLGCLVLCGCDQLNTMQSNLDGVISKITDSTSDELTLGQTSSSTVGDTPAESQVITAGIDCSELRVFGSVTDVHYATSPKTVSLKLTIEDLFSIEETIHFDEVTDDSDESKDTSLVVTCTDTLCVDSIENVQDCFSYLDENTFYNVSFTHNKNEYSATLQTPYLLQEAPLTTYTDCKAYCDTLYQKLSQKLEDAKAIQDGATGIIYHNTGGNEFNLTSYRMHLRTGESMKIEIEDLPEGFTCEDIRFYSDTVGYATVAGDGTVTGRRNGSATITVSLAGAAVYRTVMVQVY